VAASATPAGKQAEVGPLLPEAPRAPTGPSVTFITGMPSRPTDTVCHISAPASRDTFSFKVILDSKDSIVSSIFSPSGVNFDIPVRLSPGKITDFETPVQIRKGIMGHYHPLSGG
jgi:hypothetical protein